MSAPDPIATSDIAAEAFLLAELDPIASFADDSSQASDARQFYTRAMGLSLAQADWSFARALVELPKATMSGGEVADDDLPHAYKLPSDMIALRRVYPDGAQFRADEKYIFADQSPRLRIRYTRRIQNENLLPDHFKTVPAVQLAILLSPRWVASRVKREDLQRRLIDAIEVAKVADRGTASSARSDGRDAQGWWADEVTR
jgi:hypothetical protein